LIALKIFGAALRIGGTIAPISPLATCLHWWREELQLPATIKCSFL